MIYFFSLFLVISHSFAQLNENFELRPIEIWTEQYNQSFQQVTPVNIVTKDEIKKSSTNDMNRLLKQQTGIQVQEEDAWGLRPNIGIRGTPPHRSRKVTFYEDGVLIGPAPYSAPASYYNPHISRIETVDIYKGLSSVVYGPNNIGGVINYMTPRFLNSSQTTPLIQYGSFNTVKVNIHSQQISSGPHKFILIGDIFKSDGFKVLDGGGNTGFKKHDVFMRYNYRLFELPAELSLKLGWATEHSNETYLGLSIDDFNLTPLRRYRASAKDNMRFQHLEGQLGLSYFPASGWQSETQIYRHHFNRNWQRLNNFSGPPGSPSITDVLRDPTGSHLAYLDLLKGNIDSDSFGTPVLLARANNNRFFISQGIQNQLSSPLYDLGRDTLKYKVFARLHHDQIERRHTFTHFKMDQFQLVEVGQSDGVQNLDSSMATSLSGEAEYTTQNLTILLNARTELVNYKSHDFVTQNVRTRSDSVWLPGLGVLYKLSDSLAIFASANQAVTLVGPQGGQTEEPEKALNLEFGSRFFDSDSSLFLEALFFQTDYQNIQGICSFSSGCLMDSALDSSFKGGRALIQGFEFKAHSQYLYKTYRIPFEFNSTILSTQFRERFTSNNPEWGVGQIEPGDPFPYAPQIIMSLNIGLEKGSWSHRLITQYTGSQFDQSVQLERLEIQAFTVFDFFSNFRLNSNEEITFRVDNVLDTSYVVSFRPFGARPGKPRSFQVGYRYAF